MIQESPREALTSTRMVERGVDRAARVGGDVVD